jgi:CHAD domain-containing protein
MLPEEFHPGLIQLNRLIARDRTKALKAVLRSLTAPDYSGRFEDMMQHISGPPAYKSEKASGPIEPLTRGKIRRHYDKVGKRGAAINAQTPPERVHELRIECKKLRYLLELFAELYPSSQIKRAIQSLKGLQDVLGNFNDYSVQQRFLLDLARRRKLPVDVLGAVSGLVAVLHQRRLAEQRKIQHSFASFQEPGTAEMFHALAHPSSDGPVNS